MWNSERHVTELALVVATIAVGDVIQHEVALDAWKHHGVRRIRYRRDVAQQFVDVLDTAGTLGEIGHELRRVRDAVAQLPEHALERHECPKRDAPVVGEVRARSENHEVQQEHADADASLQQHRKDGRSAARDREPPAALAIPAAGDAREIEDAHELVCEHALLQHAEGPRLRLASVVARVHRAGREDHGAGQREREYQHRRQCELPVEHEQQSCTGHHLQSRLQSACGEVHDHVLDGGHVAGEAREDLANARTPEKRARKRLYVGEQVFTHVREKRRREAGVEYFVAHRDGGDADTEHAKHNEDAQQRRRIDNQQRVVNEELERERKRGVETRLDKDTGQQKEERSAVPAKMRSEEASQQPERPKQRVIAILVRRLVGHRPARRSTFV